MTVKPPSLPCPHCRDTMPPGFLLCRPCWREIQPAHRIELFTASGQAHFPDLYPLAVWRLEAALKAARSHLAQYSSSLS